MKTHNHTASWRTAVVVLVFPLAMSFFPPDASSQSIRSKEETARIVTLENVTERNGSVSGEVHNASSNALRNVQLYIRHTWLWNNEFHPGNDDFSTLTIYTVDKEIPAGGRAPFSVAASPESKKAAGGHFITTVSVAGYTEVIPQKRSSSR